MSLVADEISATGAQHLASRARTHARTQARIQAGCGLIIALFLVLHLVNFLAAIVGPGAYDSFQSIVRPAYQYPAVEVLVLGAIVVHLIFAGVRLARESRRNLRGRARWHRYAGVFLMLVIVGHVAAVRGPSWFADIYPGAQGLAFTLNAYPGYFYPYYFLLACAGFYHALQGVSVALPRLNALRWRLSQSQLVLATGCFAVLAVLSLAGLGGWLYEIPDPYDNDAARLFQSVFGVGG